MTDRTAEQVIASMAERFTSGNSIAVERAHITREEWTAVLNEIFCQTSDGHGRTGYESDCPKCQFAILVEDALEKLELPCTGTPLSPPVKQAAPATTPLGGDGGMSPASDFDAGPLEPDNCAIARALTAHENY